MHKYRQLPFRRRRKSEVHDDESLPLADRLAESATSRRRGRTRGRIASILGATLVGASLVASMGSALALSPDNDAFADTWARTDRAVAEGVDARTWMWGPDAISYGMWEEYDDAPGGVRLVQYYDKSRMEITDPNGDPSSDWYVTNGLLARELISGQMQIGDDEYAYLGGANIPVAGDVDAEYSLFYSDLVPLLNVPLDLPDQVITRVVDWTAEPWNDQSYAVYGVTDGPYVIETNHRVASVFWDFMNSDGPVWEDERYYLAPLFVNPYYATGYPITEAYWTVVPIGGTPTDVLVQCFERRCLTYTPGNPDGFQVEAGNIGLHYYIWRYQELPPVFAE